MKKTNINDFHFSGNEVLTESQMKKIVGGYNLDPSVYQCKILCNSGHDWQIGIPAESCEEAKCFAEAYCEQEQGVMSINCGCKVIE